MGRGFWGGDIMFTLVPVFITVVFVLIVGVVVVGIVSNIRQWHRNNNSPRLTVGAVVTGKRVDVTHHHTHQGDPHMTTTHTSTWYYATFQVASGDRMEFSVNGQEYGLLSEGDEGFLTFQGTRYLGFEREMSEN